MFLKYNSLLKNHILHIELNRPDKLNAFTDLAFKEVKDCFLNLPERYPNCRVVILTSCKESRHFSAGLDLVDNKFISIVNDASLELSRKTLEIRSLVKSWQEAFSAISECRIPVLCGIHGACVGAGVDLITSADIRYATRDASFSVREVKMGLAADLGSLQRLGKVSSNDSLVRELCLTGRSFSGYEAKNDLGLVSKLFDSYDDMIKGLIKTAEEISGNSPLAVYGTKKGLDNARENRTSDALEFILNWNMVMLQSEDVQKSFIAQMSKEKPEYSKL